MTPNLLRVYLVDDEPLALERLTRLLGETARVVVAGSTTEPTVALDFLIHHSVDALFLDIQMPGMNGFELLSRLPEQPLVIFTTAYDEHALKAFQVNSIDFLVKPIDPEQLTRALQKLERLRGGPKPEWMLASELRGLLRELSGMLPSPVLRYPERIASRVGERMQLIELAGVTHFFARDKLTYAVAGGRNYCVDYSIAELEQKLDPERFIRIHRAILLNLSWVEEVNSRSGDRVIVFLKDPLRTRLTVARDRWRVVKERLRL
jgi:two-component system LytT family response regulator